MITLLDKESALLFANEWVTAWNQHDIERILSHYSDDVRVFSPLIVERMGLPEGYLQGKAALRDYWKPSFSLTPPLCFRLIDIFLGVNSVAILYENIGRRLVVENFTINQDMKVSSVTVHWSLGGLSNDIATNMNE
ncbi:MAG TPA: nuclear transport factor 2 family protein [Cellvibrio sp.]|nr:nuclear transport factor 2 family protein [Cellvibrio sp.]